MNHRARRIERLLSSTKANPNVPTGELIDAISDMDDSTLVELFRVCWVVLAFRLSGEEDGANASSDEGKFHWMQQIHEMAGRSLDRG